MTAEFTCCHRCLVIVNSISRITLRLRRRAAKVFPGGGVEAQV